MELTISYQLSFTTLFAYIGLVMNRLFFFAVSIHFGTIVSRNCFF